MICPTINTDSQASTSNISEAMPNVMLTPTAQINLTQQQMSPLVNTNIATSENTMNPTSNTISITLASVRPFPTITKTSMKRKGKKRGKSRIYIDNPEKQKLHELHNIKEQKRLKRTETTGKRS